MSAVEIIETGERDCLTCGKPHVLIRDSRIRGKRGEVMYGSWADPTDGHPYRPESWEAIARRLLKDTP